MKTLVTLAAVVWFSALGFSSSSRQQTQPICPATNESTVSDCVKALTGCICSPSGWTTWIGKKNCTGCRMAWNYSFSCTNPSGSPFSSGHQDSLCDQSLVLDVGTCPCDGTSLLTITGDCGSCPDQ